MPHYQIKKEKVRSKAMKMLKQNLLINSISIHGNLLKKEREKNFNFNLMKVFL